MPWWAWLLIGLGIWFLCALWLAASFSNASAQDPFEEMRDWAEFLRQQREEQEAKEREKGA